MKLKDLIETVTGPYLIDIKNLDGSFDTIKVNYKTDDTAELCDNLKKVRLYGDCKVMRVYPDNSTLWIFATIEK